MNTPLAWSALPTSLLVLLVPLAAHAQTPEPSAAQRPYIVVGQAKTRRTLLAIPKPVASAGLAERAGSQIHDVVISDLTFMDLFRFLDPKAAAGDDWSGTGAEFLLKYSVSATGNTLTLEGALLEIGTGKSIFTQRYTGPIADPRTLAHAYAGEVVTALTGLKSIFLTKIAMSCERGRRKEIYVMDFDGTNVRQLTQHRSTAIAPAWSPDGSRLAYSLYTRARNNIKNIDLYEYNFRDQTIRVLSARKGINSGAAYSPDGSQIALTLSHLGNPEIFVMDRDGRSDRRLTSSFGFDVDPAWSPDGRKLAFVSSRSGQPMVYGMNADGTNVVRLTFAGQYNATPSWSPTNNKIAFNGTVDGRFDVFIMNPDGTNIERLTKNQGQNEDVHFSPDGQFVVFSSTRTGQKNIYAMNIDGTFVKRLTYGLGACASPKWSPAPQAR